MPTSDRKLGVAVCGVGWCASQHIAAFLRNPRTAVTWLCARDADRARANLAKYGVALPDARITTSYDEVLAASDVDIVSIATPNHLHAEQAVAAAPGRQAPAARKADRPRRRRARAHSRRGATRRRADDRVLRAAIQPVSGLRALAADRRLARRDPLRAHAVPVAGHRLVQRVVVGAHARERAQPPARGRLPRGRRAALVFRPGADVGERAAYAHHRGLRMADVDRREHDPRRFRPRSRDQLHRLHAAVQRSWWS